MTVQYREVCTAGDLIVRGAERAPDRDVLVFPGERRTYSQLLDRSVSAALSLRGLGVRHGDRVGILLPNSLAYLEAWFGAMLIGAIVVPINGRFQSRELQHVVPDAGLRVLLVAEESGAVSYVERIGRAFPDLSTDGEAAGGARLDLAAAPLLDHVVDLSSSRARGFLPSALWDAAGRNVPGGTVERTAARVALGDPATIFYTSGTTALPKGCVLTHEAMVRQGQETADRLGIREGDALFGPLPMFHVGCSQPLFAMLWKLGTYCSMPIFDPAAGLRLIQEEQATTLFTAFPPITNALVEAEGFDADSFGHVRTVMNVAPPAQLRDIEEKLFGARVVTGFGMTEVAGSMALSDPDDPIERRVLPGLPLHGAEVEVCDIVDGSRAPAGVEGEIVLRGPTLFSGYHGRPDLTAEAFDEDGWYHSGDLGMIDSDGLLHYRGRLKDMLKVGGENVAAIEVESHLMAHPGIAMAAVVALADERLGEVPVAYVEVVPETELSVEEVIDWCEGMIASFKVPRHVRFVTDWPMSATKIRKVDLQRRIAEEFGLPPPS
ncbi:MAG: acyl--CoA ligase [Acidimicrobiia bacterium]|nr:acyl--CoA ligase [Acidimicrobiia bacterium]